MKFSKHLSYTLSAALLLCGLSACEKPPEKEARYIRQGNALFEKGEYAKARLEYKNAAQIIPTDAEPRYRLGLVDEAEGDVKNAFANFVRAEQQNKHFHPALLKLANYFIAGGNLEEADHRLTIVLLDKPDDSEAHALRAAILLRQKEIVGAEKEAQMALKNAPSNISAVAVLTGVYSAKDEEAKAISILEEGINKNPTEVSLLLLKAMLFEKSANLAKVGEAYQAIFKLKPQGEAYRLDLANIYKKAGKLDEAEVTLREGVAAMPDDWVMKKDLIYFLSEKRDLAVAEREIQSLIQTNPQSDFLNFWLADLYISHNATDRAVALLEKLVEKAGTDTASLNARTSLARINFVKGNQSLANKLIAAVLVKEPGNQSALLVRAQLAFTSGRPQEAVTDLRTIIRDNPKNVEAYKLLAEILLQQGHADLAIDTQKQLIDIAPTDVNATIRLAQMYLFNQDPTKAQDILASAIKLAPTNPVAWESLARISITIKDWKGTASAIAKLETLPNQELMASYLKGEWANAKGTPQEALPYYTHIFSLAPNSPLAERALSSYVETTQKLGQLDIAVTTLLGLKPTTPFIQTLIGGCFEKLNRFQDAAIAFDSAISMNPTSPDAYLGRAAIYYHEGKLADALTTLQKAIAAFPSDLRASFSSADILIQNARYDEAASIYEEVLKNNPTLDAVANNMAQMIADHKEGDTAALNKALKAAERFANSQNPLFIDTLAWVYFKQGNLQQAQPLMERVIASKTELPAEVHYHYAKLLQKLGKTQEMKEELIRATSGRGNYLGLEDAKTMLKTP